MFQLLNHLGHQDAVGIRVMVGDGQLQVIGGEYQLGDGLPETNRATEQLSVGFDVCRCCKGKIHISHQIPAPGMAPGKGNPTGQRHLHQSRVQMFQARYPLQADVVSLHDQSAVVGIINQALIAHQHGGHFPQVFAGHGSVGKYAPVFGDQLLGQVQWQAGIGGNGNGFGQQLTPQHH